MPRLMPMLTTTAVLLDMVRLTAPLLMITLWLLTLTLLGITMASPTDTTTASTMLLLLLLLLPLWLRLYPSQLPTPTLEPTLSSQPQSSRLSLSWLEDKQARCHSVLLLLLKIELLYNIINKKRR